VFTKLLVANRGEIAIRAFRAAYELNVATAAVYPFEDRDSLHRLKADESGITLVGPRAEVLALTGYKARAISAAREAGLPVLESSAPSADVTELLAASQAMEFPLFVKAVACGGGRGMRRVANPADLPPRSGAVQRIAVSTVAHVEGGDLLAVLGDRDGLGAAS
jgi:pyruvate carboxylase